MEEAAELGDYLPLSFKSPKEQKYIEFLWGAFETNYTQVRSLSTSHSAESDFAQQGAPAEGCPATVAVHDPQATTPRPSPACPSTGIAELV